MNRQAVLLVAITALTLPARWLRAQCADGSPPPCGRPPARAATPNSVAVLYFDNASRDTADAYLADGLTEEVILRLQQVRRLEVKSRFESQRVRGRRNVAPAMLGRELRARFLVNGTVQRSGERIVVRVELTQADRGVGIWSERYDRASGNVLDVIDDVARGVATGVAGQLLPAEAAELARRPTVDPIAYEHFVRGNVFLARRSRAALARAIEEYEAAAARDPGFKRALARIAYAYALGLPLGVADLSTDTVAARALAAGERAIRLAPDVADTWIAVGFRLVGLSVLGSDDRMREAVASLARAVQLDPRSAEAHHQYGQGLAIVGPDSLALSEYRRALELEPGRAVTYEEMARIMLLEGRPGEAQALSDSALAADPQLVRGLLMRARARLALGDQSGADRDVTSAEQIAPGQMDIPVMRALVLAIRGDTLEARRIASRLPPERYLLFSGELQVALGSPDRALAEIEAKPSLDVRCYRLRFPLVAALRGRPDFDRLARGCPSGS